MPSIWRVFSAAICAADLGRSLGDEGKLGPRTDADVDGARGDRLLHARAAAEADHLEIDAVFLEDAALAVDLQRHELECSRLRLPDPNLGLRLRVPIGCDRKNGGDGEAGQYS